MVKKIVIGVAILLLIVAALFVYMSNRNRTLSPEGAAELSAGDLTVSVLYSRPSVRGRVVFGTEDTGALQPYGKYWRLGANESTEITFNKDVSFNGEPLKAGTYRAYAIPGPEQFEIILNSALGKWGAFKPDHSLDVLKTKVPVRRSSSFVEQFTIRIIQADGGADIVFEWADAEFSVPVR